MNPNYEILEQIMRIDIEAGVVTVVQRDAERQIVELNKKSKVNEEQITKLRADMIFVEGEMRRQYKKNNELDEKKEDRASRLFASKTDDEHKSLKREVDNIDKEIREYMKRIDESELKIEDIKQKVKRLEDELAVIYSASADERQKAENASNESKGKLDDLSKIRDTYLDKLDDRLQQHYTKLSQITKNPNGSITRVDSNACGNCHMGLSPQILNNVMKAKDVEFCPSCYHILLPNT